MSSESALRDRNGADYELIETLRWEPATGFVRIERHRARLQASADALGFRHDTPAVEHALASAAGGRTPLRIRLTLSHAGDVACTSHPFEPIPSGTIWRLRVADTRLDAADPLLRHKTSRRDVFQAARLEFTVEEADEVILLNGQGKLCEGTITNLFLDLGNGRPLLTPALANGLLPGVLRGELIEQGRAVEADLLPHDLAIAKSIFVGNSLRGLIPAAIATD
ncbi:aminotransferase class IV family protein [Mesorhizobium sp. 1B3]|uniref:aminotransferase class IV family protein n=1 Tax=Mesorhizobium sp. 1B3 TaxID=3243599 RepID=UPI003D988EAE